MIIMQHHHRHHQEQWILAKASASGYGTGGRGSARSDNAPEERGRSLTRALSIGSRAPSRAPSTGSRAPSRAGSRAPMAFDFPSRHQSVVPSRASSTTRQSHALSRYDFASPSAYDNSSRSRNRIEGAPSTDHPGTLIRANTTGLRRTNRVLGLDARGGHGGPMAETDTIHICAGCAASQGLPYSRHSMTAVRVCRGCHHPVAAYPSRRY